MYAPQISAYTHIYTHTHSHLAHAHRDRGRSRDNSLRPHDLKSNARGKRSKRALEVTTEGIQRWREGGICRERVREELQCTVDSHRVRAALGQELVAATKRFNTFLSRAHNMHATPTVLCNTRPQNWLHGQWSKLKLECISSLRSFAYLKQKLMLKSEVNWMRCNVCYKNETRKNMAAIIAKPLPSFERKLK